jgi:Domain of unknown function (DUF1990)
MAITHEKFILDDSSSDITPDSVAKDLQPPASEQEAPEEQPAADGVGPLYHRSYSVNFLTVQTPQQLMQRIKSDLAAFSPSALADFEKSQGSPWTMKVDDEFDITIFGPWNGRVRVTEVEALAFKFITLKGHPEAGEIRFTLGELKTQPGALHFEIYSRARSRDGLVQLGYQGLPIGKFIQRNAWTIFCNRVVKEANGQKLGKVKVTTIEVDDEKSASTN